MLYFLVTAVWTSVGFKVTEWRLNGTGFLKKLKGALCSFEEEIQTPNFNINKMKKVKTQTQKYLSFPELNKQDVLSSRTLFEAGKVAGSATYKQSFFLFNLILHENKDSLLI